MWSESEEQKLQEKYPYTPPEILSREFGRSPDAIKAKANRMGLSKSPNYEKGYSVVRAESIDLSQIDDNYGHYLAGVVAGEGSFTISDDGRGYKSPELYVGMDSRDKDLLKLFGELLGCGAVRERKDNSSSDIWTYCCSNFGDLVLRVIPFFDKYEFKSAFKQKQYDEWREWILQRVPQGVDLHKTTERS